MAKKRRLSKRDREIKVKMKNLKNWDSIMEDDKFKIKLTRLLLRIDRSLSGVLQFDNYILKYITFYEGMISNIYFVAFLSENGADVADEPLPMFETSF